MRRPAYLGTLPLFLLAPLFPPHSRSVGSGTGAGTPCEGSGPPSSRPRPASSLQGQEAKKEPPGAMDGAVMEGPLFLQSQRFGTKVIWGRGAEPHQSEGWAVGPRKREGRAAGKSAAPGAESLVKFPRTQRTLRRRVCRTWGTRSLALGRPSGILLGKLCLRREASDSKLPALVPPSPSGLGRRRSPAASPATLALFP